MSVRGSLIQQDLLGRPPLLAALALFFGLEFHGPSRLLAIYLLLGACLAVVLARGANHQSAQRLVALWCCVAWTHRLAHVGLIYGAPGIVEDLAVLHAHPLSDPYFPLLSQSPSAFALALVLGTAMSLAALLAGSRGLRRVSMLGVLLASVVVLTHRLGVGSQLSTTSLWAALFSLAAEEHPDVPRRPLAALGQMVASFIFLGAAVGKLDWDYLGESLCAGWIASGFLPAPVLGSVVIGAELLAAFAFLLPAPRGALVVLAVVTGMVTTVSVEILPVVSPIIGVCTAAIGLHVGSAKMAGSRSAGRVSKQVPQRSAAR